jgi:hypothetical protein
MNDATQDNEAMVDLDKAELVVPLDAVKLEQKSPVDTNTSIDTTEFFEFFANFHDWPTNGLRMAESAERQGYSSNLVKFFKGMPGSFATEADVMPYAEDPSRPPFGKAITVDSQVEAGSEDLGELTLTDITQGTRP